MYSSVWRCLQCDSHVKVRLTGSSDRDRDRDRNRDRGFGCIASCVPSSLRCKPLSKFLLHVLMSQWCEVTRQQRRHTDLRVPEWQCAACKTRSFLSRDTCRGCGKLRDVKHDEYIDEWSQTVAWPQQIGLLRCPCAPGAALPDECGSHLGKQGAGGGDETSSALGPENGPSTGQVSSGCRIGRGKRCKLCRRRRRLSSRRNRR